MRPSTVLNANPAFFLHALIPPPLEHRPSLYPPSHTHSHTPAHQSLTATQPQSHSLAGCSPAPLAAAPPTLQSPAFGTRAVSCSPRTALSRAL